MAEQAIKLTPLSLAEAARHLRSALLLQFSETYISRDVLLFLLAQIWIESGRGKGLHNNNPGNLSSNAQGSDDFWRPPWYPEPTAATSPRYRDLHAKMLKGQAPKAFLAFESMGHGFNTYVTWLRTKFPSIIQAARLGDALAVAHAIRVSGYCPDCAEAATSKNLLGLVAEFKAAGLFSDESPTQHVFRLGDTEKEFPGVKNVQTVVGAKPDGHFGPKTEAAVIRWQAAHGLVPDGLFGPISQGVALKEWRP